MIPLEWQEQVPGGCSVAVVAMVTGLTQPAVLNTFKTFCGHCGTDDETLDHLLAELGYAVQRKWPDKQFDGEKRKPWPPKSWADLHICSVYQTRGDVDGHYVAMDRKGIVLDPADAERTPSRLSRYARVEWVAAIVPV